MQRILFSASVKRVCTQYSFLDQQLNNNVRIINKYCLYLFIFK